MKKLIIPLVLCVFFSFSAQSQIQIDNSGNAGVGTATPTQKLDIDGKLRVRDVTNDNTKDSVLVVSGDGTVAYRDASTLSGGVVYLCGAEIPVVSMCCQTWMAKNLDVDKYRNGDSIPKITDPVVWAALTIGAYCYYNNDSANYASIYGKIYNWYAVTDSRRLAPEGWHIPTDFEWKSLANCLGGESVAGGLLKETGTTLWNSPNTAASNSTEFTGLPGGGRFLSTALFIYVGEYGWFWGSTESSPATAWSHYLSYDYGGLTSSSYIKSNGFSVRCIKD